MEKLNLSFFVLLRRESPEKVIDICMYLGLIPRSYHCPQCGETMALKSNPKTIDRYYWVCRKQAARKQHKVSRTIRAGSYFEKSHLSMPDILFLTHLLVHRAEQHFITHELGIADNTATSWYSVFRDVCLKVVQQQAATAADDQRIGGAGRTVEVDVGQFGKRSEDKWVVGGVERGSRKRCFFRVVKRRNKRTLLQVIQACILPGTAISAPRAQKLFSDCHEDKGFQQQLAAGKYTFNYEASRSAAAVEVEEEGGNGVAALAAAVPPEEDSIEGTWAAVMKCLPCKTVVDKFESYLAEYVWRRVHSDTEDLTRAFLESVKRVYPIRTHDVDAPNEEVMGRDNGGPVKGEL